MVVLILHQYRFLISILNALYNTFMQFTSWPILYLSKADKTRMTLNIGELPSGSPTRPSQLDLLCSWSTQDPQLGWDM